MSQAEKAKPETKPATATKPDTKAAAPDIDTSNWSDANVNIDAWYAPEVTGVLVGRVVEVIRVNSAYGEQDVVKIKTANVAKCIQGKGDDAHEIEVPVGGIVAVRISANLSILLEMVEHQCAVQITPSGKMPLAGGKKTMWKYNVKFKGVRAQLARPVTRVGETTKANADTGDLDNLPF